MAGHMAGQARATARNAGAELFCEACMLIAVDELVENQTITSGSVKRQQQFKRDDCHDVFDCYALLEAPGAEVLHLWTQVTCYKGHHGGGTEPNKTYEIRETLTEALGLRRWLMSEGTPVRTIHITLGPSDYTYKWFKPVKKSGFDLSIYLTTNANRDRSFKAFESLGNKPVPARALADQLLRDKTPKLTALSRELVDTIVDWIEDGAGPNRLAIDQARLLERTRHKHRKLAEVAVKRATKGGADIKGATLAAWNAGGGTGDPVLDGTVQRLSEGNPFHAAAVEATSSWSEYSKQSFSSASNGSLGNYIRNLWLDPNPARVMVSRRLLLRIHTNDAIDYVQDIGITGITEHNVYSGTPSAKQVAAIVKTLERRYVKRGIKTAKDLETRLCSQTARRLVVAALSFESNNGAALRPSFYYVEEALKQDGRFAAVRFGDTDLPSPVGFHADLAPGCNVRSYQNLKVVVANGTGDPLAILKAKFFSEAEFARRCKEEAYVALTLRWRRRRSMFREQYSGLPFVMFVDMAGDTRPPEYAVRRLVTAGWEAVFDVSALTKRLERAAAQ